MKLCCGAERLYLSIFVDDTNSFFFSAVFPESPLASPYIFPKIYGVAHCGRVACPSHSPWGFAMKGSGGGGGLYSYDIAKRA